MTASRVVCRGCSMCTPGPDSDAVLAASRAAVAAHGPAGDVCVLCRAAPGTLRVRGSSDRVCGLCADVLAVPLVSPDDG
ncbi:hypothetical protein [Jiangella gansuensis]|uniref:hypothetical protein n=1 Tax=Jiangella gansuensis TaxID=281473 RepID=UPI00047BC0A6|nr:hypothetical protein [Jiangella gansuensis]